LPEVYLRIGFFGGNVKLLSNILRFGKD